MDWITDYAIPFWIFLTLFLFLPLVVVIVMTFQRVRNRAHKTQGFEVKLVEKETQTKT